jgi:site-specific recombinase XerD
MRPLFDNIKYLHHDLDTSILPNPDLQEDYRRTITFLKSYVGSLGTFNSYRREVEKLLQWCWLVKKTSLKKLKRDDIEQFMRFCQNPPQNFISLKKCPRFIEKEGQRVPNPDWRPFVAGIKKSARKQGHQPQINQFSLSQGAIKEIFAILGTFFNFLIAEEYLPSNPVALIRQKSKFVRKRQQASPVRRLSIIQWDTILSTAHQLAANEPEKHERTLFILSLLFGMYLRISELAASERWIPTMNDFAKDSQGAWWFTTVGKGNKERQIAVSDAMLASLSRWRTYLGLSPLPSVADNSPLLPRLRGTGPMSDTAPIRRIVQYCFDQAEIQLRCNNHIEEADTIQDATVHWLRHTGISEDVKIRPREHVRDDAGHSSSETTDRYVDDEREARYASAKKKRILL